MRRWIRTCQTCDHKQEVSGRDLESLRSGRWTSEQAERYRETRCRQCKSAALDFGSDVADVVTPAIETEVAAAFIEQVERQVLRGATYVSVRRETAAAMVDALREEVDAKR